MDTRKLYYEDSHLMEFTATVTGCEASDKGYLVTLDATAFYPEGGGQACDLGTLADATVLDVQEKDGQIYHLCDKALSGTVTGKIDAARRFDLMQQHSGEHIVSGIISRRFGFHNVGFHVGKEAMEIDFDGFVPPQLLDEIEQEANRVVWENLSLKCWYPSEEELPGVPYRSKRALPWPVRIVEIPGVDSCACCGVHVKKTGEIGLIKLLSCVKFHEGVRIEMLCGGRALGLMQAVFNQNKQVSQFFSAKRLETGAAAQQVKEQLSAETLRANTLQTRLFAATAAGFADKGDVFYEEAGLTPGQVRELAEAISKVCGGRAAVFSGNSLCIFCPGQDLRPLGQALQQTFGARGGGKTGVWQGSVTADVESLSSFFQAFRTPLV